jgi:hypothetical protein
MRFTDFMRTAVLLFAGAATVLAVVSIVGATSNDNNALLIVAVSWWAIAAVGGLWLGRKLAPTAQIARLLANARASNSLPEVEPGAIIFNRLWPLAVFTIGSGAVAFLIPQIPAIAAGYSLGMALTWRKQAPAVIAIEERDGAQFHLDRTSPFGAPKLIRTPGLRKVEPEDAVAPGV